MQYETLVKIYEKFNIPLDSGVKMPISIPQIGRDGMAELFYELGFTIGAEVGVEKGTFSESLCRRIPGLKLFCIDAWQAYRGYRDHMRQNKLDGFYEETKRILQPYNVEIIRKFSMD